MLAVAALAVAACSSSSSGKAAPARSTPPAPATEKSGAPPRPAGPAATFSGPVTGGKGISLLSATVQTTPPAVSQHEYFASGTATSYSATSQPASGRWTLTPASTASYKTRVIVRIPKDPKRFNGTVVVEWLNVSAGSDTDPDYSYAAALLTREGYAYVGVSAQQVGVNGASSGDIASQLAPGLGIAGLRKADPVRYGSLHHPGDAYSYDMFTQVARGLRTPGRLDVLGGVRPTRVIALGESQSAARLTSYVDGVQPLTREFDGFFIHSRGGGASPFTGEGDSGSVVDGAYLIRTDIGVPVMIFETETDFSVLRYDRAEQPDSADVRVWEAAGTSHADAFVVGAAAGLLGCSGQINSGPEQYIVKAAISALDQWVRTGAAPASAPRFVHTGAKLRRDARGNAVGGIRTPPTDVPVATLTGDPAPGGKIICSLFGQTKPFSTATLLRLYGTKGRYVQEYATAADRAVAAGDVLAADRPALLAEAQKVTF